MGKSTINSHRTKWAIENGVSQVSCIFFPFRQGEWQECLMAVVLIKYSDRDTHAQTHIKNQ
jgi:hypothetical protein